MLKEPWFYKKQILLGGGVTFIPENQKEESILAYYVVDCRRPAKFSSGYSAHGADIWKGEKFGRFTIDKPEAVKDMEQLLQREGCQQSE